MSKVPAPNYTQTPNILFDDMMKDMGEAELKVVLAVVRNTLGWHRKTKKMSIAYLVEATGLSRQGVLNGVAAGVKRGALLKRPAGQSFTYELVVNEVDTSQRSRLALVNEVDHQLVNEVDTTKKDIKKGKEKPAPLPPEPVAQRTPYRQQHAAEHTKAAKTYGLLPSDFTALVNAYLIACGTMATANADTDMGGRELTKAKDAAITGLAVGILEPADVEKRVAAFRESWKDENKQVYYSNIVNQSVGTKNKTAAPAGVAVAMENEY